MKHVSAGDPLNIPAEAYNAFVEAAEAHKRGQTGVYGTPGLTRQADGVILVRNDSGGNVDRFGVLGIDAPIIDPDDHEAEFKRRVALAVNTPASGTHDGLFVVLQESAGAGALVSARVTGVTPVLLNLTQADPEPTRADIADGDATALDPAANGVAQILWHATPGSGDTQVWAVVRLGGGGGGLPDNIYLQEMLISNGDDTWIVKTFPFAHTLLTSDLTLSGAGEYDVAVRGTWGFHPDDGVRVEHWSESGSGSGIAASGAVVSVTGTDTVRVDFTDGDLNGEYKGGADYGAALYHHSLVGDGSQYILVDGTRAFTGDQSMGTHKLTNVVDPVAAQDAATKNYVDTNFAAVDHGHDEYILVDGTRAFTGDQSMGTNKITNLANAVADTDALPKGQADGLYAASGHDHDFLAGLRVDLNGQGDGVLVFVEGTPDTLTTEYLGDVMGLTDPGVVVHDDPGFTAYPAPFNGQVNVFVDNAGDGLEWVDSSTMWMGAVTPGANGEVLTVVGGVWASAPLP